MIPAIISYGLVFASVLFYSLYSIFLKKIDDRLISFFWIFLFTGLGFLGLLLIEKYAFHLTVEAFEMLQPNFILLFILKGALTVVIILTINKLLDLFEASMIFPLAQISILFTTGMYIFLGDTLHISTFIGLVLIILGVIIAGLPSLSPKGVKQFFTNIPLVLYGYILLLALLTAASAIATYIATEKTHGADHALRLFRDHLIHGASHAFLFINPTDFYFGTIAAFLILFFIYLWITQKNFWSSMIKTLRDHYGMILIVSAVFWIAKVCYYHSYRLIADKNMLLALNKLTIPLIIILCIFVLKEKMSPSKLVGITLITIGGLTSVIF